MRKSVFSVALLIAIGLMLWAPRQAQAQATGSIAGVVTDETGAVIPGVTVTITNSATNQSRTTVTGTDGYYSVPVAPAWKVRGQGNARRLQDGHTRRHHRRLSSRLHVST